MMDEMLRRRYYRFSGDETWNPPVNLYETPDAFIVCIEVAGMSPETIDVRAHRDAVIISGHRPNPQPSETPEQVSIHLMEIDSGRFYREVEIPTNVQADLIKAKYRDGYLWITLPKTPHPSD